MSHSTHEIGVEVTLRRRLRHGLAGLSAIMAPADDGASVRYLDVHLVLGRGSLVAVLSHVDMAGVDSAVVDLFRVRDGLLVEHWSVVEAITPRSERVNSGKF